MKYLVLTGLVCFVFFACSEGDIKLENALRKEADSVFAKRVKSLGSEIDSLCAIRKDSLVQLKYDSIIEVRKERIRELSQ